MAVLLEILSDYVQLALAVSRVSLTDDIKSCRFTINKQSRRQSGISKTQARLLKEVSCSCSTRMRLTLYKEDRRRTEAFEMLCSVLVETAVKTLMDTS